MLQPPLQMLLPMPSLPPSANSDRYYTGVANHPHIPSLTGVTYMSMYLKKFSNDEEKAIDGNLAYVEYLLAKRKKKLEESKR